MNRAAKNYLVAADFTVVAAAAGFGLQNQHCFHFSPAVYGVVSLCAFTLGTVGRLGFHNMTWGGASSHEKLDFRLFLLFYFIGLAAGIAALKTEPESQNAANKTRETGSVCNFLTKSHKVIVTVNLSASCILTPIYKK